MTQLLLNIEDESQTNKLLDFLKTLNYVSVEELTNDTIIVSEDEKNTMRERLKNAKPENFQDWDQLKSRFK
jgi:hypothetical protein